MQHGRDGLAHRDISLGDIDVAVPYLAASQAQEQLVEHLVGAGDIYKRNAGKVERRGRVGRAAEQVLHQFFKQLGPARPPAEYARFAGEKVRGGLIYGLLLYALFNG